MIQRFLKKSVKRCIELAVNLQQFKLAVMYVQIFCTSVGKRCKYYRLHQYPEGVGIETRQKIHADVTHAFVEKLYEHPQKPDHIIHVSCTGYASPNSVQKLVSKMHWGNSVQVTSAYHMGCAAASRAVDMASSYLSAGKKHVDVVHTELCSLHFNPLDHGLDQLVAQTLFADGCIRYSIRDEPHAPGLAIISIHEEIIPNSLDMMTWKMMNWGFRLSLMKEIPVLISKHVEQFVETLCEKALLPSKKIIQNALFAVHPGGPKILDQIQKAFHLEDQQIQKSRAILQRFGNMSSATVPHIWQAINTDEKVPTGSYVISLAFGPGLTISGSLLQKV